MNLVIVKRDMVVFPKTRNLSMVIWVTAYPAWMQLGGATSLVHEAFLKYEATSRKSTSFFHRYSPVLVIICLSVRTLMILPSTMFNNLRTAASHHASAQA